MIRVRYLGVITKKGRREYGFHVEDKDKSVREVILTIDNLMFLGNQLKFQEAPDLCYQKMKSDVESEDQTGPITSPVVVTSSDVAKYRDSHPDARGRHRR